MSILRGVFEGDINCDCLFTRFFEDPEAGGTTGKDPGSLKSINRKHSRTECKNSLEMSILRCVFEGDINCDCIFIRFFEDPGDPGRFRGNPAGQSSVPAL